MSAVLTLRTLTIVLVTILCLSGCSITKALRVEDRALVDIPTMIDEISSVPIIFIGERHDVSAHHALQLEVMKGLKAKGKLLAIGMEMFEVSSQKALDAWSSGKLPTPVFVAAYRQNWRNVPYGLYEDIFNFARENRIPIIALNAPREIVAKVSRLGLSSLTDSEKQQLPPDADEEVSDEYLDFIRTSYAVHGGNSASFRHICEAQMLRNRVMASRIRDYHHHHPKRVVVVIAGGGHVRETGGVPAELRPLPFRIILPPIPRLTAKTIRSEDADYLLEESFSLFNLQW